MQILTTQDSLAADSTLAYPSEELLRTLRDASSIGSGFSLGYGTAGQAGTSGVAVTPTTALRQSVVYACIRVLSESVAQLPLLLYQQDGEKRSAAVDDGRYTLLHDEPNSEMSGFTFRETMMVQLLLRGVAFAEIERNRRGEVLALWPLPMGVVTPKRDREGQRWYRITAGQEEHDVPPENMLHFMGMSLDGYTGISPITYERESIGLAIAADRYGGYFYANGGQPKGVLEHPLQLSDDARDRLRAAFEANYSGLSNVARMMVLEEGLKYQQISINPSDAQFLEVRQYNALDVARIFRVPPHLINELDRATWGNVEQMEIAFVVHALMPWLERFEQEMTRKLLAPAERAAFTIEHKVDGLLRGDVASRTASYATGRQNGWLSANDIRRMENLSPIVGGDVYLVPLNMIPADQAGQGLKRSTSGTAPAAPTPARVDWQPVAADVAQRVARRWAADQDRLEKKSASAEDAAAWLTEHHAWVLIQVTPLLRAAGAADDAAHRLADAWLHDHSHDADAFAAGLLAACAMEDCQ